MTGFKPGSSFIGSDRSANCATTTGLLFITSSGHTVSNPLNWSLNFGCLYNDKGGRYLVRCKRFQVDLLIL